MGLSGAAIVALLALCGCATHAAPPLSRHIPDPLLDTDLGGAAGKTYTSSSAGGRLVESTVKWGKASAYADATVIFDATARLQRIEGFGGAFTEASAVNYMRLTPADQAKVMEYYFGKSGLRYSLGRVPMNSCDFSPKSYSYDDNKGAPDPALKSFDDAAAVDVKNGMIPMILDAMKAAAAWGGAALQLFGSPWSPPAWMKLNDHPMVGSDFPCLKEGMESVWADYFVRWIAAYKKHGIDFWGMTAQNEPGFADNTFWEACTFSAETQRDFIRDHLGPRLEELGVKLMAFDDDKSHLKAWADTILGDPATAKYVWGMGLHWYAGDWTENMAYVRDTYPNATQLATEGCTCIYDEIVYNTTWKRAHRYLHDMINDLNNGVVGWVDWNLLLDDSGILGTGGPNHAGNTCFAHMQVLANGTLVLHDSFYAFAHISHFVPRGSWVVAHALQKGPLAGVEGSVFEWENGSIVAVFANPGNATHSVKLREVGWLNAILVDVPAEGVVTVVLKASAEAGRAGGQRVA